MALVMTLGLSIYLYTQIISLQSNVSLLSTQIFSMAQQINGLQAQLNEKENQIQRYQTTINELNSQISNFRELNAQLESQINQLKVDYQKLQLEQNILQEKYGDLQTSYNNLQNSYKRLEAENSQLHNILNLYEKIPHDYYSSGSYKHHSNTYSELCSFLTLEFKLPRGYEKNVFDCSESSAYLEWALENAGFDAYIAVGRTPWNPESGNHAWVIVFTSDKYIVPIESTSLTGDLISNLLFLLFSGGRTPGVIYSNDDVWQNYSAGYDRLFKNIYDAVRNCGFIEEWDWWIGYWGFT